MTRWRPSKTAVLTVGSAIVGMTATLSVAMACAKVLPWPAIGALVGAYAAVVWLFNRIITLEARIRRLEVSYFIATSQSAPGARSDDPMAVVAGGTVIAWRGP